MLPTPEFSSIEEVRSWLKSKLNSPEHDAFVSGVDWTVNRATLQEAQNAAKCDENDDSVGLTIVVSLLNLDVRNRDKEAREACRDFWKNNNVSLKHYESSDFPDGEPDYYPNDEISREFCRGIRASIGFCFNEKTS